MLVCIVVFKIVIIIELLLVLLKDMLVSCGWAHRLKWLTVPTPESVGTNILITTGVLLLVVENML